MKNLIAETFTLLKSKLIFGELLGWTKNENYTILYVFDKIV